MASSPSAWLVSPSSLAIVPKRSFTLLWIGQFLFKVGRALTGSALGVRLLRAAPAGLPVPADAHSVSD